MKVLINPPISAQQSREYDISGSTEEKAALKVQKKYHLLSAGPRDSIVSIIINSWHMLDILGVYNGLILTTGKRGPRMEQGKGLLLNLT